MARKIGIQPKQSDVGRAVTWHNPDDMDARQSGILTEVGPSYVHVRFGRSKNAEPEPCDPMDLTWRKVKK